jgi:hypothetical protein
MRQLGFASAVSTGKGALEVGVENGLRFPGAHLAFSRYYTTIKNNTDQEVGFDFPFVIEPGELTLLGVRDGDTAHLRVGGFIDYRLLSPSGPFGGTYDESTGRVFNYFAEIGFDDSPDAANLSMVLLVKQPTELSFATAGYSGHVSLPTIPAFGELTVYYDMYAHMNVLDSEVGGKVRLGDPTDLVGGAGAGFIQRQAVSDTPEPGTLVLFAAGVAGMLALRPRTRTRAA